MNPETRDGEVSVRPTVGVEVVSQPPEAPEVPKPPKNYWEENGFLKELARVCVDLESEPEQFLFNADVRQIIETINNAQSVQDFSLYTDTELQSFSETIRRRVPQIEREVISLVNQLSRARAVAINNVDFI